jgi:hypothetical protein
LNEHRVKINLPKNEETEVGMGKSMTSSS